MVEYWNNGRSKLNATQYSSIPVFQYSSIPIIQPDINPIKINTQTLWKKF